MFWACLCFCFEFIYSTITEIGCLLVYIVVELFDHVLTARTITRL